MASTEQARMVPLRVIEVAMRDHDRLAGYLEHPECRLEGRVRTVDDQAEAVALGDDLTAKCRQPAVHRLLSLHVSDLVDPVVHQSQR